MSPLASIHSTNSTHRWDFYSLLLWFVRLLLPTLLLAALVFLDRVNYKFFLEQVRANVSSELGLIRAELEGNINANIQTVRGLAAAIVTEPEMNQARFAELSAVVLEHRPQLRNLGAAPDLVVRLVYPLEGNSAVLGLDLRQNREQWPSVKRAAEGGGLVLAGPVNLVQGGQAFIGRVPVLIPRPGSTSPEFWGLISAVMDIEPLYREAGLLDHPELDLALKNVFDGAKNSDVFYGEPGLFSGDAITLPIALPGTSWQLAGRPAGGWPTNADNAFWVRILLVLVFLAVVVPALWLTWSLQRQRTTQTRLRALFELSPIGIALNDFETGVFLEANDALIAPTGYSRAQFLQLSYWQLTPDEYQTQEEEQLNKLRRTGRYGPFEKEYIRATGERYPVMLNGMLVRDLGGRRLIWSMIEDLSERKRVERMKNDFVSTVSHELRTPLTSIAGALSLLRGGALGELPGEMIQVVEIAQRNSQQLTHLISDLLDMDKLMSGRMNFERCWVALNPLLEQGLQAYRNYAEQYGVRFVLEPCSGNPKVYVDPLRLEQVLANLLSNAIKFSPERALVKVLVERVDERVRVSVIDSGPGVPEKFRPQLFQKFSQADSSDSRSKGGSGLGLAISRELIEKMDGEIGFTSELGPGACFYFELPCS